MHEAPTPSATHAGDIESPQPKVMLSPRGKTVNPANGGGGGGGGWAPFGPATVLARTANVGHAVLRKHVGVPFSFGPEYQSNALQPG